MLCEVNHLFKDIQSDGQKVANAILDIVVISVTLSIICYRIYVLIFVHEMFCSLLFAMT